MMFNSQYNIEMEEVMNKDPRIEKIENLLDKLGNIAVEAFHYIALFIIGCMIAWCQCIPSSKF